MSDQVTSLANAMDALRAVVPAIVAKIHEQADRIAALEARPVVDASELDAVAANANDLANHAAVLAALVG